MIIADKSTIKADIGMKLTNGTAFGSVVHIGINDNIENWHEITEEEAEKLQIQETPAETEATETDYISALQDLGVKFNG